MKYTELHNQTKEALQAMLGELREKLTQLQFELAEKKLKNVKQILATRKDIARVLTALRATR